MKRSGISRGKGFKPRTTALRRGALQRNADTSRKAVKPKPPRPHVWPNGLRDAIRARAGDCCDMCGKPLPAVWECHHKRLRSQGGTDEASNLLALGYGCHSRAHENRAWAKARGYIVERPDDPATRPVLRHGVRWQLPTDGGWVDCDPPADFETSTEGEAA